MTLTELKNHVDRLLAEGVPGDAEMYCEGGYVSLEEPCVEPQSKRAVIW